MIAHASSRTEAQRRRSGAIKTGSTMSKMSSRLV